MSSTEQNLSAVTITADSANIGAITSGSITNRNAVNTSTLHATGSALVGGNLNVNGSAQIDGTLLVKGGLSFNDVAVISDEGEFVIKGMLNAPEGADFGHETLITTQKFDGDVIEGVITANNMHRTWECDVKALLKSAGNTLKVIFHSPTKFIAEAFAKAPTLGTEDCMQGFVHIRKAHCMFGWDWGAHLPDMGIWRDVSLISYNTVRLNSVSFTQHHGENRPYHRQIGKFSQKQSDESWRRHNAVTAGSEE